MSFFIRPNWISFLQGNTLSYKCLALIETHKCPSIADKVSPLVNPLELLWVAGTKVPDCGSGAQTTVQLEHVPQAGTLLTWETTQQQTTSKALALTQPPVLLTLLSDIAETLVLEGLVIYQALDFRSGAVHIWILGKEKTWQKKKIIREETHQEGWKKTPL